jgi:hypothetical protein
MSVSRTTLISHNIWSLRALCLTNKDAQLAVNKAECLEKQYDNAKK